MCEEVGGQQQELTSVQLGPGGPRLFCHPWETGPDGPGWEFLNDIYCLLAV